MIKIGVFGASGRVGKLLLENIKETQNMSVSTVYVRDNLDFSIDPSILVTSDMKSFLNSCDAVIDFSLPDACETLLEAAMKTPTPLVIGVHNVYAEVV